MLNKGDCLGGLWCIFWHNLIQEILEKIVLKQYHLGGEIVEIL
ncbi:hypothetical protein BTN49_2577 [Candidatus Enterovibrio escicola]|uniref:Uncharacterized protein n=1 Tax=Candidatus Enterovibrio escicola TaxID=1927127 RepID=A0A2A5T0T4_9GAMM|nr:hypothetical protein BTN49_2577 [Candidatus Enterovibrio escacola]